MASFDVVVVGGGTNGLTAAAYLAKGGTRVLVLEKRPLVGGACVTEEPWPGFHTNTYSYVCGLVRPRIVEDLQLLKFGYEPLLYDPQYFLPFADGRALAFWMDTARTVKEIARFSAADAKAYPKYVAYWDGVYELVEPALTAPPVSVAELFSMFPGPEPEGLLRDLILLSAEDFLDEWFESEEVKAALCINGIIGSFVGPRSPGSAYIIGHHSLSVIDGQKGAWGFAKAGMGRIAEAMAAAARSLGAVVRTGVGVRRILVRGDRVTGVETDAGEMIRAKAVASSLDPKQTFLRLLPEDTVDAEFLRQVRRYRTRGAALKLNAALDGLPNFTARAGTARSLRPPTVDILPSMEYAERGFDEAKYGAFSRHPFLEMTFQSVLDPTLAPPGKHVMSCVAQYAPTELEGTTWDTFRPEAAEIVLDTIGAFAPNIRNVAKHWELVSPLDMERTIGATGGSAFQGEITPDQIFSFRPIPGWAHYRMPVAGLYLCGAATHPGGGVSGAPGYNAAQVMLEDLKASKA